MQYGHRLLFVGSLFLLIIQSFYPMSMFHRKSVLVVILYFQPIYAAGPKVYLFVRRYLDPYPFGQSLCIADFLLMFN